MKIKENKNRDKNINLPRELKKLRGMKVKVKPIETGALRTIHKDLVKEREELEIGLRTEII